MTFSAVAIKWPPREIKMVPHEGRKRAKCGSPSWLVVNRVSVGNDVACSPHIKDNSEPLSQLAEATLKGKCELFNCTE